MDPAENVALTAKLLGGDRARAGLLAGVRPRVRGNGALAADA